MNKKIKTQSQISGIVKTLQKEGRKIVTYNGSFDILHAGHVQAINEAKKQGDVLIILLNSDVSIKMYKGPSRPINQERERSEMLAGLSDVDYVVLFDEINPKNLLAKIMPNIHCNGSDWGKSCVERSVVEEHGGKIHILRWKEGFSTSGIIEKIRAADSSAEIKAVFLDRDGTININDPEYIHKISDVRFVPGAISALKKLSKSNCKIIIITNQSGIARGYYKEKDMELLHTWMLSEFKKSDIRIDRIYHCPHGPDDECVCRKPEIGMFLQAAKDFGVNLSKSWFVGDDKRDVIAGRNANIKTIKIGDTMPSALKLEPNYYVKDLKEAVEIILQHE